jgi:predicted DNA-binding transcriptional regulator AlpA
MTTKHKATAAKNHEPASESVLDGLVSKARFAAKLDVTPRTVEIWIAQGIGPRVTKLGKSVYFAPSDILAWLETRRQPMRNVA